MSGFNQSAFNLGFQSGNSGFHIARQRQQREADALEFADSFVSSHPTLSRLSPENQAINRNALAKSFLLSPQAGAAALRSVDQQDFRRRQSDFEAFRQANPNATDLEQVDALEEFGLINPDKAFDVRRDIRVNEERQRLAQSQADEQRAQQELTEARKEREIIGTARELMRENPSLTPEAAINRARSGRTVSQAIDDKRQDRSLALSEQRTAVTNANAKKRLEIQEANLAVRAAVAFGKGGTTKQDKAKAISALMRLSGAKIAGEFGAEREDKGFIAEVLLHSYGIPPSENPREQVLKLIGLLRRSDITLEEAIRQMNGVPPTDDGAAEENRDTIAPPTEPEIIAPEPPAPGKGDRLGILPAEARPKKKPDRTVNPRGPIPQRIPNSTP